ncbi:MAG: hypothetical protein O2860_04005, partial [Chloroflexi bacterium]|nr:hypothetical protein [Chloroflexota bacterium]
ISLILGAGLYLNHLSDFWGPPHWINDMNKEIQRTAKTIRMNEDAYHQARVASVSRKKSLGQWLEEAIAEKLCREQHPQQH